MHQNLAPDIIADIDSFSPSEETLQSKSGQEILVELSLSTPTPSDYKTLPISGSLNKTDVLSSDVLSEPYHIELCFSTEHLQSTSSSSSSQHNSSRSCDVIIAAEHQSLEAVNLALLSPFAIVDKERSQLPDTIEAQSATFQQTLDSFPSSPQMPPPASSDPSILSDVLQSPFGAPIRPALLPADDTGHGEIDPIGTPDSIERDWRGHEVCVNAHVFSDSAESFGDSPITPDTRQHTSNMMTSSSNAPNNTQVPFKVEENLIVISKAHYDYVSEVDIRGTVRSTEFDSTPPNRSPPPSCDSATSDSSSGNIMQSESLQIQSTSDLCHESPNATTTSVNERKKRSRDADDLTFAPTPKRLTLASQKKEHQKLASPFRSPLLPRSKQGTDTARDPIRYIGTKNMSSLSSSTSGRKADGSPKSLEGSLRTMPNVGQRPQTPIARNGFSSVKAKSQFKSPFTSSTAPGTSSRMNNSHTVQELERKVQLLKRAIKIKKDGDEEKLRELVKKWRGAGREAAWELWRIVRENDETVGTAYPGTNAKSFAGSSAGGWGWATTSDHDQTSGSWGWDDPAPDTDDRSDGMESPSKLERALFEALRKKPVTQRKTMLPPTPRGSAFRQGAIDAGYDDCDDARPLEESGSQDESNQASKPKSLGTMLHQLGIAHETLGWVEEEGDFVDP